MAATNKCLAQSNKSTGGKATKKRMGIDGRYGRGVMRGPACVGRTAKVSSTRMPPRTLPCRCRVRDDCREEQRFTDTKDRRAPVGALRFAVLALSLTNCTKS